MCDLGDHVTHQDAVFLEELGEQPRTSCRGDDHRHLLFNRHPGPRLHGVGTRTDYAGASMGDAFLSLFGADPIQGPVFKAVVGDRAFTADDVVFNYLKATPRPERPAGKFKAASLVNVWDNALFFHNGQFHELRDAVAYMAEVNYLPLTDADIDAVIEYLRTF